MHLEIGLILFGGALLLLVLFCIPILLKVYRAANDITVTLQVLNERLPVILKNMEEISTSINNSTNAINSQVQKYTETSQRLNSAMNSLVGGVELLLPLATRMPVLQKITEGVAVAKGVRTFLNVLKGKS